MVGLLRVFGKSTPRVSAAYRTKSAKLAMSLIITMACVHKSEILHNDISPSNILFHFPPDHLDRIYIGVCGWGMATRFIKEVPLVYDYPTKEKMDKNEKEHFWMALELFYVYGPCNFETSLERIQRKHLYTKEANAYSVGKVALRIWGDKWDKDLFKIADGASISLSKLSALTKRFKEEVFISKCSKHLYILSLQNGIARLLLRL